MPVSKVLEMDRQAAELPLEEQRELMIRIARRVELGASTEQKPVSLYGLWANRVPDDFDLDASLESIRSQWKQTLGDSHS